MFGDSAIFRHQDRRRVKERKLCHSVLTDTSSVTPGTASIVTESTCLANEKNDRPSSSAKWVSFLSAQ
jgi:hypothetical protein